MPGSNTFSKRKSSTRSSRYTVQEDQYTQHRPPQFVPENIPSGLTAGSSNEPRDGLTQELESMVLSGQRDGGPPHSDPRDRSSSGRTSNSNRTPRSTRPDIARYALMQPQDPTKFSLTSETLKVFDNEQGGHEQYPNVPHWRTGPYSPGSYPFAATAVAAADLSDSMYATKPARSQATDGSWVLVTPSDERQDRFDESICGAGAMFYDMPAEPAWNEYDVR
ncbi:hypothetical protein PG985_007449 [Apiospora marii]|uniref:Uncharacterized protein n=1 Tax=Apiospora marii TaxID=335849 RepID=A0ABR1SNJ1_9PEZI